MNKRGRVRTESDDKDFYPNGTLQQVNEQWFAYPYTGPAFSAASELGPFDTQEAALDALRQN